MMNKLNKTRSKPMFLEDYLSYTKEILLHELKKLKLAYRENYDTKDHSLVKAVFEVEKKLTEAVKVIEIELRRREDNEGG